MAFPKAIYEQRAQQFGTQLAQLKQRINTIATIRLVLFFGGVGLLIWLFIVSWYIALPTMGIVVTAFLLLMRQHAQLLKQRTYLEHITAINQEELQIAAGDRTTFDSGADYLLPDHPYAADLDIFGAGSMFQYINRTATRDGRHRLAEWLNAKADNDAILARQKAIAELQPLIDWRQDLQVIGRTYEEKQGDTSEISAWMKKAPQFLNNKLVQTMIWALPIMTFGAFFATIFGLSSGYFVGLFFGQLALTGLYLKRINSIHVEATTFNNRFAKYADLIDQIESRTWETNLLQTLQEKIKVDGDQAGKRLRDLNKIIAALDSRMNLAVGILLNGILLWDLRQVSRLERWKKDNRDHSIDWIDSMAHFDALNSLGTFYFNHPTFTMPLLSSTTYQFEAKSLGHPLIPIAEMVTNDITIKEFGQFYLITGSNMAGKSTFLRSIGVNMVLAMAGAPVCAQSFTFMPLPVFTSMRIGDSIQHRESTFYAELKRLQQIIQAIQKDKIFIILDEILKGTNSRDKLTGSIALVKQLVKMDAVGIIATHDLALAALEKDYPKKVHNYCFEVDTQNGQFIFDYKLKSGVCQVQNATQLMQQMGLSVEGV